MGNKNIYERFIWFDHNVRESKYPNATGLAEHFEVSVKTAQRDVEFMRDRLNCPLTYDKSRKGYYYEDETFSLPFIYLSSEELTLLLIARKLLQDINSGFIGNEITSVLGKISTILKNHFSGTAEINDVTSFQFIEYSPASPEALKLILEACLKNRAIEFFYHSPASEEGLKRTVDPYHLLNYMGTWHLIAYCHKRNDIRDFHLGRMSGLCLLNETFTIQKGFDITDYLNSTFGIYKGKPSTEVVLRFSPLKSRWIKGQVWHKDQKVKYLKDGSMEISFRVANYWEIMGEILKHGAGVKVIKPGILRKLIKEEVKRISDIY